MLNFSVDADWAGDKNNRQSTTGYIIRYYRNSIFWKAKNVPEVLNVQMNEMQKKFFSVFFPFS